MFSVSLFHRLRLFQFLFLHPIKNFLDILDHSPKNLVQNRRSQIYHGYSFFLYFFGLCFCSTQTITNFATSFSFLPSFNF
eukprot:UN18938